MRVRYGTEAVTSLAELRALRDRDVARGAFDVFAQEEYLVALLAAKRSMFGRVMGASRDLQHERRAIAELSGRRKGAIDGSVDNGDNGWRDSAGMESEATCPSESEEEREAAAGALHHCV